MKRFFLCFLCSAVFFTVPSLSKAQIFEPSTSGNETVGKATSSFETVKENKNNPQSPAWLNNPRKNNRSAPVAKDSQEQPKKEKKPDILDMPQTERPTLDGVVRGHVSMQPVLTETDEEKEDRFIFFYYTDFGVRTTMSGKILCDVRFVVLSTLDQKINNVSVRLKWPNMETPVSFSNVSPNVENYYDYTLLGDGCYSMDKAPNIIVNRCRAKGLSQKDCAGKIRWLRKAR